VHEKEALNNYLRCQGGVKKRLNMLIYYVYTALFRRFLPSPDCLANIIQCFQKQNGLLLFIASVALGQQSAAICILAKCAGYGL